MYDNKDLEAELLERRNMARMQLRWSIIHTLLENVPPEDFSTDKVVAAAETLFEWVSKGQEPPTAKGFEGSDFEPSGYL